MAKVPVTVYLEPRQLAQIERQAQAVGKTRSAWIARALVRAAEGELEPLDDILLDQLTKVRANQETVLKLLVGLDKSAALKDVQRSAQNLGERMLVEARARVGR
jgi:uncharacterized protein (DUF1778 family)